MSISVTLNFLLPYVVMLLRSTLIQKSYLLGSQLKEIVKNIWRKPAVLYYLLLIYKYFMSVDICCWIIIIFTLIMII